MPTGASPVPAAPAATRRDGRDRRGGFTLIELMLALAVLGMIAALALPRAGFGGGRGTVAADAAKVAALLRADRNAALASGAAVESRIDTEGRRLRSGARGVVLALSPGIGLALHPGTAARIVFTPDGRSSGGTLRLTGRATALDVAVNPVTAAVEVRAP